MHISDIFYSKLSYFPFLLHSSTHSDRKKVRMLRLPSALRKASNIKLQKQHQVRAISKVLFQQHALPTQAQNVEDENEFSGLFRQNNHDARDRGSQSPPSIEIREEKDNGASINTNPTIREERSKHELNKVIKMIRSQPSVDVDREALTSAMRNVGYFGSLQIMNELRRARIVPDLRQFNTILDLALQHKYDPRLLDSARKLFKEMRNAAVQPDSSTFEKLIMLVVRYKGDPYDLIGEMRRCDVPLTTKIMNCVLKSLNIDDSHADRHEREQSATKAWAIYKLMKQDSSGLKPDKYTYASLMGILALAADQRAFTVLEDIHRDSPELLDARMFVVALTACKKRKIRKELSLVQSIMKSCEKTLQYTNALYDNQIELCYIGNNDKSFADAYALYLRMIGGGGGGGGSSSSSNNNAAPLRPTLYTFCALMANVRTVEHVDTVIKEMERYGVQPEIITMNNMIRALGRVSRQLAVEQFDRMTRQFGIKPDAVTFNTILKMFVDAGDPLVFPFFDNIVRTHGISSSGGGKSAIITERTITIILEACKRINNRDKSLEIEQILPTVGIIPTRVIYNALIAASPSFQRANELYQRMVTASLLASSPYEASQYRPDVVTFYSLLQQLSICIESGAITAEPNSEEIVHGWLSDIIRYNIRVDARLATLIAIIFKPRAQQRQPTNSSSVGLLSSARILAAVEVLLGETVRPLNNHNHNNSNDAR